MGIPVNTHALYNENIGREINGTEYKNLRNIGLNDDTIAGLDFETFNKYKDFVVEEQISTTKYFKDIPILTFSMRDEYRYIPVEITEEEYNNANVQTTYASTHETTYKKLTITLSNHPSSYDNTRIVVSDLTWKQIPANKSYDVFALYATSGTIEMPTAYQNKYELAPSGDVCALNTNKTWTTTYLPSHANWNTVGILSVYTGAGISMEFDHSLTPCVYDLGMIIGVEKGYNFQMITSALPVDGNSVTIRASYQHAQGTVSLSESKNYQFSTSGYGGVILFNNSNTAEVYDKMGGVSASL